MKVIREAIDEPGRGPGRCQATITRQNFAGSRARTRVCRNRFPTELEIGFENPVSSFAGRTAQVDIYRLKSFKSTTGFAGRIIKLGNWKRRPCRDVAN